MALFETSIALLMGLQLAAAGGYHGCHGPNWQQCVPHLLFNCNTYQEQVNLYCS